MGDFNLDLLQYNRRHIPTQEFIDSLFSHAFFLLISKPTRLTSYFATLIDNIFTNNLSQNVLNGISFLMIYQITYRFSLTLVAKPWAFSICTEKPVVPVKNQMEQTFPLEIFRKKWKTFRGIPLLPFLPK